MRSGRSVATTSKVCGEAVGGLQRQAVDQIEADAAEARSSRAMSTSARTCCSRLRAIDDLQHARVEILHADAQAVEAMPAQHGQLFARGVARVGFHGEVRAGARCARAAAGHPAAVQHAARQPRGRAAAQMQFAQRQRRAASAARYSANSRQQGLDVGRGQRVVARQPHVAAAEAALRLAERNVHVDARARIAGAARPAASESSHASAGGGAPQCVMVG